jgi:nitroimidazol reductase NimA-like FMN-containing flavoprotein (pyridoxamine 5'-phosphate oxidase superfamily)
LAAVLTDGEGLEVLVAEQCLELLDTARLGRIAVTIGAVPAIFPVHYRLLDGQIVFRTKKGTNLQTGSANSVVAFEVDSVDAAWEQGWSVLVVGVAREVTDEVALTAAVQRAPELWDAGANAHCISILPGFVSGRRFLHAA